jgi:hypothetical protein
VNALLGRCLSEAVPPVVPNRPLAADIEAIDLNDLFVDPLPVVSLDCLAVPAKSVQLYVNDAIGFGLLAALYGTDDPPVVENRPASETAGAIGEPLAGELCCRASENPLRPLANYELKPLFLAAETIAETLLSQLFQTLVVPVVYNVASSADFAEMAKDDIDDTLDEITRTNHNFTTPKKINPRGSMPAAKFWPRSFPVAHNVCSGDIFEEITDDKRWSRLVEKCDLVHLADFEYRPSRAGTPRKEQVTVRTGKFHVNEAPLAGLPAVRTVTVRAVKHVPLVRRPAKPPQPGFGIYSLPDH